MKKNKKSKSLPLLSILLISALFGGSVWSKAACEPVVESVSLRRLSGKLDHIYMFNSNSPEIVGGEGILLSTLSPVAKEYPEAHLDHVFHDRFAVFMHHINKQTAPETTEAKSLLRLCLYAVNESNKEAKLVPLKRATYLSQPDAPFAPRESLLSDPEGRFYSGPGDRVTRDFLFDQAAAPQAITIGPHGTKLVEDLTVPVAGLRPASNGRSYLGYFQTNRPLRLVLLSSFTKDGEAPAPIDPIEPALADKANLVGGREGTLKPPTPPLAKGYLIYGRVAGVQIGSEIVAHQSIDLREGKSLKVGLPISSLRGGTYGTGQVQTARMARRYSDTAYGAHGNYGVHYLVKLNLKNHGKSPRKVAISFNCPLKESGLKPKNSVTFLSPCEKNVFFRGEVALTEEQFPGKREVWHLVLHKGERGKVLSEVSLDPYEAKAVDFELYYPADATPPQLLMVESPQVN